MPGFNISKPFSKEAESTDHNMGRFTIKAAVLLLTRFEEVRASDAQRTAHRQLELLWHAQRSLAADSLPMQCKCAAHTQRHLAGPAQRPRLQLAAERGCVRVDACCTAQMLYLDADNFVLRDPSVLFASEEYKNTSAIFWQDYWSNTLAPEVRNAVMSLRGMLKPAY
jgi:hypothetical protein